MQASAHAERSASGRCFAHGSQGMSWIQIMGWEEPVVLVLGAPQCPTWAHANAKYKAGTSPFVSALFQLTETTKHTHKKKVSKIFAGHWLRSSSDGHSTSHDKTALNVRERR